MTDQTVTDRLAAAPLADKMPGDDGIIACLTDAVIVLTVDAAGAMRLTRAANVTPRGVVAVLRDMADSIEAEAVIPTSPPEQE